MTLFIDHDIIGADTFSREAGLLKPTADCQKQDSFLFNDGVVAARALAMKGGGLG